MAALKAAKKKNDLNRQGGRQSVTIKSSQSSTKQLKKQPAKQSTKQPTKRTSSRVNMIDKTLENVTFILFGPHEHLSSSLIGSLRAINQQVETFMDLSTCFNAIQSSQEKVFFITFFNNNEMIAKIHEFVVVEAIFILDADGNNVKGDYPKLFGVFTQQEELFRTLKDVLQVFEQVQLEEFVYEDESSFLWLQLWKEDLINRKQPSNKDELITIARNFYRETPRIVESVDKLEKSYRPADAINWCCNSPFPTRFLLHSLRYRNKTQLNTCRFMFADAARTFRQNPKSKTSEQLYRGMKITSELLNKFESHVGQAMCTSGFFPCVKSRTNALNLASLPTYRPDLLPVLFKIDCDPSSLLTTLPNKNVSTTVVFDACTTFRVVYINRGPISIIKLKTAGEVGKKITSEYLHQHPNETIPSILDKLLKPPKPPTPPPPKDPLLSPPPLRAPPTPLKTKSAQSQRQGSTKVDMVSHEMKAQQYVEEGNIDLAIIAYRRIQPITARILNTIGQLCADRKGDYDYALQCYQQALQLQDMSGEDISETLTRIGSVHYKRGELDLAFDHHKRALQLREADPTSDSFGMACNLIGMADVHWALQQYHEAISNAERALELQEAHTPQNEASIGATLALLATIYHSTGDMSRAIDICKRAIDLFERIEDKSSPILAEMLYKLGSIESGSGALNDALIHLEQSVKIYGKILPREHPDCVSAENELRRVAALCKSKKHEQR